jgi:hypothetical protein
MIRTSSRNSFRTLKMFLFGAVALALSLPGTALAGQKHPGYLRTMDDLRLARALLQRTNETQSVGGLQDEVSLTIGNIDGAMAEMSKEIGPDRKKPHDVARIDAHMPWAERLARSLRLLEKAEQDCSNEKDNPGDQGVQARVLDYLNQAYTRITVAIETKNFDYSARNLPTRND